MQEGGDKGKMKVLFLVLLLFQLSLAVDYEEKAREFQKRISDPEFMKKINMLSKQAKEKYKKDAFKIIQSDGKEVKTGGKFLSDDERLYIFMSSSVPENIWIEYARQIDKYSLFTDAKIYLRGCISGCRYIKPTLEFIRKILTENGKNEKGLIVDVMIDPFLFRLYQIDAVPCFVYAKNVQIIDPSMSEALSQNLKTAPTFYKSCGSYSFDYHIKKLYEKSKSLSLKKLYKKITKNSFYEGSDE